MDIIDFTVGGSVEGYLGVGVIADFVPDMYPTAGWLEVDGLGSYDTFPPATLWHLGRNAATGAKGAKAMSDVD